MNSIPASAWLFTGLAPRFLAKDESPPEIAGGTVHEQYVCNALDVVYRRRGERRPEKLAA